MTFLNSPGKYSKEYLKLDSVLTNVSYHITLSNLIKCKTLLNIPNSNSQSIITFLHQILYVYQCIAYRFCYKI